MLPPYETDEVAEAVVRGLAGAGVTPTSLTVTADDARREWLIDARFADGRELAMHYPFSAPDGIATPAELATWFTAELRETG